MTGNLFIISAILIALVVAYQLYVSHRVTRTRHYTDQQRFWQLIMVWILPVIGATLCHFMLSDVEASELGDGGEYADSHGQDTQGGGYDGGAGDGGGH